HSEAEFCAPVTALHGHAYNLKNKADFIFLPIYLEQKRKKKEIKRRFCYYSQYAPALIKSHWKDEKILSPLVNHNFSSFFTKSELFKMFNGIADCNIGFLALSNAYDEACRLFEEKKEELQKLYEKQRDDKLQVVLLGRPYSILSPSMNKGIPEIFGALGIKTFYQDMLPLKEKRPEDIEDLLEEIHWNYAAKVIETAYEISTNKHLYPVFVSSFKCSPDSYITQYLKKLLESKNKPYLILELDEHGSSVGYETRIEASVRAFKNHHGLPPSLPKEVPSLSPNYSTKLKGKTLLLPQWDWISCRFICAILKKKGYHAVVMEEDQAIIKESLKTNTGQCIPMNAITQGVIHYVEKYKLDPSKTLLWMAKTELSCNIPLYPYHIQNLLRDHGNGMEKINIYLGQFSFVDISPRVSVKIYFAFMFAGYIRRMACRIRPYEINKGETDQVEKKAVEIMESSLLGHSKREKAVEQIIAMFESIKIKREKRPQVAIFGDFYVRDNEVMNLDLIRFIEKNGGEVITTPFNEYANIISESHFKRLFKEKRFAQLMVQKPLLKVMKALEKSIDRQFVSILPEGGFSYSDPEDHWMEQLGLRVELSGESYENFLKICHIKKYYPDLSLFVQTNPSFCCAGIVTQAMKSNIEEITGIPIITITYDGTGGNKNEAVIPYLKFPRKTNEPEENLANHSIV
ncbi:MAG: acyl-CoA dehydratase activase-related protein, partial [Spirochaetaceae bacterium]|nr:acyl-CoA dehydratase activase-related protein [Spirochaetaceae bacterium]